MGGGVVSLRRSGARARCGTGRGRNGTAGVGLARRACGELAARADGGARSVRGERERLRAPRHGAAGPGTPVARRLLLAPLAWGWRGGPFGSWWHARKAEHVVLAERRGAVSGAATAPCAGCSGGGERATWPT